MLNIYELCNNPWPNTLWIAIIWMFHYWQTSPQCILKDQSSRRSKAESRAVAESSSGYAYSTEPRNRLLWCVSFVTVTGNINPCPINSPLVSNMMGSVGSMEPRNQLLESVTVARRTDREWSASSMEPRDQLVVDSPQLILKTTGPKGVWHEPWQTLPILFFFLPKKDQ